MLGYLVLRRGIKQNPSFIYVAVQVLINTVGTCSGSRVVKLRKMQIRICTVKRRLVLYHVTTGVSLEHAERLWYPPCSKPSASRVYSGDVEGVAGKKVPKSTTETQPDFFAGDPARFFCRFFGCYSAPCWESGVRIVNWSTFLFHRQRSRCAHRNHDV